MRWPALLLLAGCVSFEPRTQGGNDGGDPTIPPSDGGVGGTPETARSAFDNRVWPVLGYGCGFCHDETAPTHPPFTIGFIHSDPSQAYTFIKSVTIILGTPLFSDNSMLLQYQHSGGVPYQYDPAERQAILDWLALERRQ